MNAANGQPCFQCAALQRNWIYPPTSDNVQEPQACPCYKTFTRRMRAAAAANRARGARGQRDVQGNGHGGLNVQGNGHGEPVPDGPAAG